MSIASTDGPKRRPKAIRPALIQAAGLARDPVGYLRYLQLQSGDPFCVRLPSVGEIYFTGHPDGAEQIFKAAREVFEPPSSIPWPPSSATTP